MKILIISYVFAPYNSIGSLRITRLAEYLNKNGHNIKILTLDELPYEKNLPYSFNDLDIIKTSWFGIKRTNKSRGLYEKSMKKKKTFKSFIVSKLKEVLFFPDKYIGWIPYGMQKYEKEIKEWNPDLIYTSHGPATPLILSKMISKKYNVPWIVEYRDLWSMNHNYNYSNTRRLIEAKLEKKVTKSAYQIVTVTEGFARRINLHSKQPLVVRNGYDEISERHNLDINKKNEKILITYTGSLYPENQDPEMLFKSLTMFSKEEQEEFHVLFVGQNSNYINSMIVKYQLENIVEFLSPVSYLESLNIQRKSDMLIYLQWNDKNREDVIAAKLYEYIGMKKPILCLGKFSDEASDIIVKNGFGFKPENPVELKEILLSLKERKLENDFSNSYKFSRNYQFEILNNYLLSKF